MGSELGQRVASSLVMAAAALLATYVGGWLFAAFWLLAALAVLIEWSAITRVEPREPLRVVLGLALSLMVLALVLRLPAWSVAAVAASALISASALGRRARDRLWSGAGFLYAAVIATVPFVVRDDPRLAAVGVLWMFATGASTIALAILTATSDARRRAAIALGGTVVAGLAALIVLGTSASVQWDQLALSAVTVGDELDGYWPVFDDGVLDLQAAVLAELAWRRLQLA